MAEQPMNGIPIASHPTGNTLPDNSPVPPSKGFEWRTRASIFGFPLICIAFGRDPNGRLRIARGLLAIGQFAYGGIVIAQFGEGIVTLSQFAVGLLAFGQLALGILLGLGQVSTGVMAIGQVVCGLYGLCQIGWAKYMWSPDRTDMEAVSMFYTVKMMILQEGGISLGEVIRGGYEWGRRWLISLFG
jgi:hypothetical protein